MASILCWNRALTSVIQRVGKKKREPALCLWQHNGQRFSLKAVGGNLCGNLFRSRNWHFYEKGRRLAFRISTAHTQVALRSLSAEPQHTGASLCCGGNSRILTAFPAVSSAAAARKHWRVRHQQFSARAEKQTEAEPQEMDVATVASVGRLLLEMLRKMFWKVKWLTLIFFLTFVQLVLKCREIQNFNATSE